MDEKRLLRRQCLAEKKGCKQGLARQAHSSKLLKIGSSTMKKAPIMAARPVSKMDRARVIGLFSRRHEGGDRSTGFLSQFNALVLSDFFEGTLKQGPGRTRYGAQI